MTLTSAKNTPPQKKKKKSIKIPCVTKGEKPGICQSMKSSLTVVKCALCITHHYDLTFRPSLNLVIVYSSLCTCLNNMSAVSSTIITANATSLIVQMTYNRKEFQFTLDKYTIIKH